MQEEFQDQTMNVEVCEECIKNFKTRLVMWKRVKSAARNLRQDFECRNVRRKQKELQDTMDVKVCEYCKKNVKTRL